MDQLVGKNISDIETCYYGRLPGLLSSKHIATVHGYGKYIKIVFFLF